MAAGTVLTFARALGEYGATSMLAGNIPGKTGTISQKIAMDNSGRRLCHGRLLGRYCACGSVWNPAGYEPGGRQQRKAEKTLVKVYRKGQISDGAKRCMFMEVKIKKKLERFQLAVEFSSDCRRIGILGASGSGKSLLLRSLAGVESADEGKIVICGRTLLDTEQKICEKPQKRKVGYLFQNYALFPTMTVEENIMAGLLVSPREKRQKAAQYMEKFQLKGLEKRLPHELSGGQQQRAALARMMICEPEVILLDEPFSALDVYLRDQLQREMMEFLKEYSGTVILVSHSRDEIYRMSEEMLVMDHGRIVGQGETKALFQNPRTKVTARLTGCKNIADVQTKEQNEIVVPDWGIAFPFKTAARKAYNPWRSAPMNF